MKSFEERFWARVEKTDSCWIWRGFTLPDGYGQVGVLVWIQENMERLSFGAAPTIA